MTDPNRSSSDADRPLDDPAATSAFYDRVSRVYDLLADAGEREARDRGLELLDATVGERALEIGYGTGHAVEALGRAVGAHGEVVGYDISVGMCRVARERVENAGIADRVELHATAVPPIPEPNGRFDVAVSTFTLELFPDDVIPEVLAELRRVLRADGRLLVVAMADHGDERDDRLAERAYKWMHRHFPHIVDCRPISVAPFLDDAGFRIAREETIEIWSLPVSIAVARPGRAAT